MSPENDPILHEMVRRIVEGWHPERIILFGSRARGDAGPEGDYDLLVVMEHEGDVYRVEGDMYQAMVGVGKGVDLIVTTPDEYAWRHTVAGTIEREAARDGTVLHEGSTGVTVRSAGG